MFVWNLPENIGFLSTMSLNLLVILFSPIPSTSKLFGVKKTDKKDAKWIADIFKHYLVSGSFIPPADIRQLRDLMRYNYKLTSFNIGEKNRAQNCFTVSNIKLDDVFTDVFGKSASAITEQLLSNTSESFDVSPFVDGRCKTPVEKIQKAIAGNIVPEQAEKLKIIRSHMDNIELCKANLESVILEIASRYTRQLELIMTVPGFKIFSAITVISEIGVDMSVFPTVKHLSSWTGITPQNAESAGKKKTTRISRAGVYLKPLLVQVSNAVVKSDKHPEIKNRYLALKKRRGHKKAIIAISRMLLTAIYHILKNDEPYNPELYRKADVIPQHRDISVEQALYILQRQGYIITPATEG